MSHVAESYVYQADDGHGYVGRSFVGNGVVIARRGDELSDEDVEALSLEDLEDLDKGGSVISVGGPDESDIVEIPHPYAGAAGIPKNATLNMTVDPDAEEESE